MSNPYIDLTGVLTIQKDYLGNLSASDPNSQPLISTIQSNLSNMYTDYSVANASTLGTLAHQTDVSNIVQAEYQRLLQKKQGVDNAYIGQQRAVALNESNRLKQNSYTKLLIVFIVTLVAFIAIMVASDFFTIIPQVVFDILSIIVITAGIYIGIFSYLDIQSRNNMNFNELALKGIDNKQSGNTVVSSNSYGNPTDLLSGLSGCVGSECCGPSTVWDQGNGVCKPVSILQPFTTLTFSYNNGEISNMTSENAASNSPYEFQNYVPIN